MNFWRIDLTTRDGAENAASMGSIACFIAAACTLLGVLFFGLALNAGVSFLIGAICELLVFLIAGFRLRTDKGAFLSIFAAVLLVLEVLMKIVSLAIGGAILNAVLLIGIINGARGALALRRGAFAEDGWEAAA